MLSKTYECTYAQQHHLGACRFFHHQLQNIISKFVKTFINHYEFQLSLPMSPDSITTVVFSEYQ